MYLYFEDLHWKIGTILGTKLKLILSKTKPFFERINIIPREYYSF